MKKGKSETKEKDVEESKLDKLTSQINAVTILLILVCIFFNTQYHPPYTLALGLLTLP